MKKGRINLLINSKDLGDTYSVVILPIESEKNFGPTATTRERDRRRG